MIASLLLALSQSGQTLYDFGPQDQSRWTTVHDTVMGGVSRGTIKKSENGTLIFSGSLSLDNNGGFTSFRTRERQLPYAGSDGIELRVKGDGRTYILSLDREGVGLFGGGYWQSFETLDGEWSTVRLPWTGFEPVNFGRKVPNLPELTPETARGLTVYLYDKKAGDFRVEFDSFATYVEGDGSLSTATTDDLPANCQTLARLIEVSGIGEELSQLDGFTLFAPTDDAFQQLGNAQALMQPSQMEALKAVLRRHVVPARVESSDALFLTSATMADGATLAVGLEQNLLQIGGATILDVDIAFGKGVVHTIDRVLLPEQLPSAAPNATLARQENQPIVPGYATLSALIEAADLAGAVADLDEFTLFAPNDAAFAALPASAVEALLLPENQEVLQAVLLRHILPSKVTAFRAIGANAQPLAGDALAIRLSAGDERRLSVAGITITRPDQFVGNAVIHEIDSVILPSNLQELLAPPQPPLLAFLEDVVAKGVPQYNNGDQEGCAQRYRQALEALLLLDQLTEEREREVRRVLEQTSRQSARDQAWSLRGMIDRLRLDVTNEA